MSSERLSRLNWTFGLWLCFELGMMIGLQNDIAISSRTSRSVWKVYGGGGVGWWWWSSDNTVSKVQVLSPTDSRLWLRLDFDLDLDFRLTIPTFHILGPSLWSFWCCNTCSWDESRNSFLISPSLSCWKLSWKPHQRSHHKRKVRVMHGEQYGESWEAVRGLTTRIAYGHWRLGTWTQITFHTVILA